MIPHVQTVFENSAELKITLVGRLQVNDELLIQPGLRGLQGQSGYFYGLLTDRDTQILPTPETNLLLGILRQRLEFVNF